MMTTNKLTKTFASGLATLSIATLSSVAGSLLVAPSAQAAEICYDSDFAGLKGKTIECGDKAFTFDPNFFTGDWLDIDLARIGIAAEEWFFEAKPSEFFAPAARTGTISYNVTILPAFDQVFDTILPAFNYVFDTIQLDSDVVGTGAYLITKDYETDNGISGTLTSTNGSVDSASIFGAKSVDVVDTFTPNGDELFAVDNSFTQVPEPLTILGAATALGFGANFKRKLAQNKKSKKDQNT